MTILHERPMEAAPEKPTSPPPDPAAMAPVAHFEGRRGWWAALLVAIFSWDPGITRLVVARIDDSWRYMLQRAATEGVPFGDDATFTYGPLVHLDGGPIFSLLAGLSSVLVALILSWATALLVIRRCVAIGVRRSSTLLSATVVTIVFIPAMRFSEAVALVAAAWLIAEIVDGRAAAATQYTVAALSGIWLLVKPSAALVMVVVALVAAVAGSFVPEQPLRVTADPMRRAAARVSSMVAVIAATSVGLWLLTGQQLALIDDYLQGAREIAGGYAEAMAITSANPTIELGFIATGLTLVCVLGWLVVRRRDARTVFVFVLVAMLLVWSRQVAFARPGGSHLKDGGVALGLIGLAVWPLLGRRVGIWLIAASTMMTAAVLVSAPFHHVGTFRALGPVEAVDAVVELINIDETVETNRVRIAEYLTPEDHVLAEMKGRRVFFSPHLGVAAFAQDTELWFPPAIQSYASYTDHLEERGAAALVAPDGPEVILHQADTSIDYRRPAWESPRTVVEMFCSFDPVAADSEYALLERVAQTCTTETLAEAVPVVDRRVDVPAAARGCPGLVTFRTFGAEADRLERLAQLIRRPAALSITIGGEEWRVIPGILSQPHILAAPAEEGWMGDGVPAAGSVPTHIDFSASFDGRGPLTVTFECWTTQPSAEAS